MTFWHQDAGRIGAGSGARSGSGWRLAAVLLGALVLHTAVLPHLRVAGVGADVLLLLAVAAGLVAPPERAAAVGFGAGLLADLVVTTPFGLSASVGGLVAWTVARWSPVAPAAIVALVGSAAGIVVFAAAATLLGEHHVGWGRLAAVVAVASMLNALLGPLAVRSLRWALGTR